MAATEWAVGWQPDGSYVESYARELLEPWSELCERMQLAGLTITVPADPKRATNDFTWRVRGPKDDFVQWFPQNEGARLWLLLNALD